jgi:formylglycine-generating enzyme required for sulfatase activity
VVTATYSNSSTKAVTGHTWSVTSGGGSLSGSTYTPPTTAGTAVLTCTFTENGVTKTADLTLNITASITSVELVNVPAGTFQRDADPANLSTVSAFKMSKYEITREQFLAIMGADPSDTTNSSGVTDPVQMTNWYHAIAFCNKLSIAEDLEPVYSVSGVDFATLAFAEVPTSSNATWNAATCNWSANGYRLPTEMEWMWAAMGADQDSQPGAIDIDGINRTGYAKLIAGSNGSNALGDYARYSVNSGYKTNPIGTKNANEIGLFDMSGNVWEWCWDWYSDNGTWPNYAIIGLQNDYRANAGSWRVRRGGGFDSDDSRLSVADRRNQVPSNQIFNIGFRVVRP